MKTKHNNMIGTAINSKSIVTALFLLGTIPSLMAQDHEGHSRGGEGRGGNGGGRENHAQSTPNTNGGIGQAYPNPGRQGDGQAPAYPNNQGQANQNGGWQGNNNQTQSYPNDGGQGRGQVQTYPNNGQARSNERYENRERDNRGWNNRRDRDYDNRGWNDNRGQTYPQQRGGYNNGYNNRTVIINRQQHVYNNAPNWQYNNLPRRNAVCQSLPSASLSINFGGLSFWYNNGVYYKPYNNSYIVAPAPIGIRVRYLPQDCRRIFIQNRPYFYYYGTYYEYNGYDYAVVPPPIGALVESIPDGYEQLVINGDTFFIVDGVQYKAVIYNGEIWYEVIKIDYRR